MVLTIDTREGWKVLAVVLVRIVPQEEENKG